MRNKIAISLSLFILCILLFYWFQFRPAKIRHDCSWVKEMIGAVPARQIMTEKELRESGLLKNCQDANDTTGWMDFSKESCDESNQKIIESYKEAHPMSPEKENWRKANDQEYKFCLRDKGL